MSGCIFKAKLQWICSQHCKFELLVPDLGVCKSSFPMVGGLLCFRSLLQSTLPQHYVQFMQRALAVSSLLITCLDFYPRINVSPDEGLHNL